MMRPKSLDGSVLQRQVQPEEPEEEEEIPQAKSLDDAVLQRQVEPEEEEEEEEEEIPQAKRLDDAVLQRQVEPEEEEEEEEEEIPQAKRLDDTKRAHDAPAAVSPRVHDTLRQPGQPLDSATRRFMERGFNRDFSGVRVHADTHSARSAADVNARAYTVRNHIVFGTGEYAPDTASGRWLLAHELTHVIQQGGQPAAIQRRIVIGGNPYTPTVRYYRYLTRKFGAHMKEFVKNMHNNGNPPDFSFTSRKQMGYEVRVRHQAIKGIAAAHAGCCNYPDSAHPDYLDSTYWNRIGWMHFKPKSPLPSGKEASDAIEAIFKPGAGTRLECMSMTVAVEYYSLLKGLGKAKFNARFPGGAGLEISTRLSTGAHPTFYGSTRVYKNLTLSSKSEILPGDWVYFKNFADYLVKHPGGSWQGENAIYLGGGKYRGFGTSSLSETDMNKELVKQYNTGLPAAARKTLTNLLAQGGGLQLSPVFRPDIGKLVP